METKELIFSFCLGLGLSACCGFRIFVPLLVSNVASLLGWYHYSPGFEWMGGWIAFAILATATALEIGGYYIPWVDHALDTIALPTAFIAGSILATSIFSSDFQPVSKWALGIMVGGGSAGLVQLGTSAVRLGSAATTGGFGNPVVSTIENFMAVLFSILAFVIPVMVAVLAIIFILFLGKKIMKRFNRSPV